MTPAHARVLRLVRRARAALEGVRLLKAAARGALCGGAAGLAFELLARAVPAWPERPWVAWTLLGAGAVAGAGAGLLRRGVTVAAAALFLDDRLATRQRIVTLQTRPPGPYVDRVAAEVDPHARLPRLPFPREAALVPAAAFLLFAAGLLPAAGGGAAPATVRAVPVAAAPGGGIEAEPAPPPPDAGTLRGLERGELPGEAETRALIERELSRPEDRRDALALLARAESGDAAAQSELARRLGEAAGAGARPAPADPVDPGGPNGNGDRPDRGGAARAAVYPEWDAFLLEYRRAVAERRRR